MMVLVTLSFMSADSTVQGVGAESESQEGLREGGWDGKGRFRGAVGDNRKVAEHGGGLDSQSSREEGGLCVSPH